MSCYDRARALAGLTGRSDTAAGRTRAFGGPALLQLTQSLSLLSVRDAPSSLLTAQARWHARLDAGYHVGYRAYTALACYSWTVPQRPAAQRTRSAQLNFCLASRMVITSR